MDDYIEQAQQVIELAKNSLESLNYTIKISSQLLSASLHCANNHIEAIVKSVHYWENYLYFFSTQERCGSANCMKWNFDMLQRKEKVKKYKSKWAVCQGGKERSKIHKMLCTIIMTCHSTFTYLHDASIHFPFLLCLLKFWHKIYDILLKEMWSNLFACYKASLQWAIVLICWIEILRLRNHIYVHHTWFLLFEDFWWKIKFFLCQKLKSRSGIRKS